MLVIGPLDDIVSFFVTIGSPASAAYSLQITHLHKRWITEEFLNVKYPNSENIASVLAAFHHVPIQLEYHTRFLPSLIVLPENDKFWSQLAAANKTRQWNVPLVMSFVLVIFSLFLTAADSVTSHPGDIGYAIAAIWTFLLPLVIGWLHIGCEPEPSHLRHSLVSANENAWVATNQRGNPVRMTCPKAIEFAKSKGADAEAGNANSETSGVDLARNDELKPVPVFNYSRAFITPMIAEVVLRLTKNAAAKAEREIPVGNSVDNEEVPVWVRDEEGRSSSRNREGTIAEVVEYCTRVLQPPSITTLEIQPPGATNDTYLLIEHDLIVPSRWAPGIWGRVLVASALALGLQWGTTGAAVFIHYIAPPPGLGCRSFSLLLYGVAGTFSFLLFLISSILAHMSRPLPGHIPQRPWLRTCQETGAIVCRWAGKLVALASSIGILLVCFFQVMGSFDNCYCHSITFDQGRRSVVFTGITFVPDSTLNWLWISGLIGAFVAAILFGCSMYAALPSRR